jgi:hypothetical protein
MTVSLPPAAGWLGQEQKRKQEDITRDIFFRNNVWTATSCLYQAAWLRVPGNKKKQVLLLSNSNINLMPI